MILYWSVVKKGSGYLGIFFQVSSDLFEILAAWNESK